MAVIELGTSLIPVSQTAAALYVGSTLHDILC